MTALVALTVFVLAVALGIELISKVPPTLHTPLMSGSNAISGISIVGALTAAGTDHSTLASVLGFFALVLATTNVVGGFLVTHRMLEMFSGPKRSKAKPDAQSTTHGVAQSDSGTASGGAE